MITHTSFNASVMYYSVLNLRQNSELCAAGTWMEGLLSAECKHSSDL